MPHLRTAKSSKNKHPVQCTIVSLCRRRCCSGSGADVISELHLRARELLRHIPQLTREGRIRGGLVRLDRLHVVKVELGLLVPVAARVRCGSEEDLRVGAHLDGQDDLVQQRLFEEFPHTRERRRSL